MLKKFLFVLIESIEWIEASYGIIYSIIVDRSVSRHLRYYKSWNIHPVHYRKYFYAMRKHEPYHIYPYSLNPQPILVNQLDVAVMLSVTFT